jgi:hypothetical protein
MSSMNLCPPLKRAKSILPNQQVPDFELPPLTESESLGMLQKDFEYVPRLLDSNELQPIKEYACTSLGEDPSSKYFITRTKSIAFVLVIGDNVYPLERNYFVQNSAYNDFSGGYRRYYSTISNDLLQSSLKRSILDFASYWRIPDRSIVLIQLQCSTIDPPEASTSSEAKTYAETKNDVTGQGIHTDGSDRAMLLCCERDNVRGAENSFHASLAGDKPLCPPRALAEGDALYFKDNALFHHVSDAFPADPARPMRRTMLLMHYPGDIYLDGGRNPRNALPTRAASVVLRAKPDPDETREAATR